MLPDNLLPCNWTSSRVFNCSSSNGKVPMKELYDSLKVFRLERSPISDGILPLMSLSLRSRTSSEESSEILLFNLPDNPLFIRLSSVTTRSLQVTPNQSQ